MNEKQIGRKIERIDRILWFIKAIWIMCPDMRLGQLLQNFAGFTDRDNFHREDDLTLDSLIDGYKKLIEERNKE
jgi:uncharacterized protein YihD (DUF1040 family)